MGLTIVSDCRIPRDLMLSEEQAEHLLGDLPHTCTDQPCDVARRDGQPTAPDA